MCVFPNNDNFFSFTLKNTGGEGHSLENIVFTLNAFLRFAFPYLNVRTTKKC